MRQPAMRLTPGLIRARKTALKALEIEPRTPDEEFWVGRLRYERERK